MSNGFARLTAIGNMGKDPEVRFSNETAIANFSIGCTERVKVKGEWTDVTEWVRCVAFGKTAEAIGQFMSKGSRLFVDGRLTTREWTDKEGNKRWSTEVICNQVIFLDGKKDGAAKPAGGSRSAGTDDAPPLDDLSIPF